jgi:hypothetical protein
VPRPSNPPVALTDHSLPTPPRKPNPFPSRPPNSEVERGKWLIPSNSLPVLSRHQNERSAIAVLSGGHKLVLSKPHVISFPEPGQKRGQKAEATQSWINGSILAAQMWQLRSNFGQNWVARCRPTLWQAAKVDHQGVSCSRRHLGEKLASEHCCEISQPCGK